MEKLAHSMAELTPGLWGQAALFESYHFSLSSWLVCSNEKNLNCGISVKKISCHKFLWLLPSVTVEPHGHTLRRLKQCGSNCTLGQLLQLPVCSAKTKAGVGWGCEDVGLIDAIEGKLKAAQSILFRKWTWNSIAFSVFKKVVTIKLNPTRIYLLIVGDEGQQAIHCPQEPRDWALQL